MDPELESMLDRANELLRDLEDEYKDCLRSRDVSERAKNITNEVLEKSRNALDHMMRRAWDKYIAPSLSKEDRKRARVYFPITSDLNAFHSVLGREHTTHLHNVHGNFYNFLLRQQPFTSERNKWLELLTKIAAEGKHVQLTPQKRTETRRIKVSRPESGSVSWDVSSVKFGSGVRVMGAPIDPKTQRIVSTPGVTEKVEIWVSFAFEGYGVDALGFCKEACQKTRALVEEMVSVLQLQDIV